MMGTKDGAGETVDEQAEGRTVATATATGAEGGW